MRHDQTLFMNFRELPDHLAFVLLIHFGLDREPTRLLNKSLITVMIYTAKPPNIHPLPKVIAPPIGGIKLQRKSTRRDEN